MMAQNDTMSLRNVHKLSAFHLRQELVRRDKFNSFFPNEDDVCYDTLLKATVEMLREDEEKTNSERLAQHGREMQETRDRLAAAKEARKAEALARSTERVKARAAIDAAKVQLGASTTVSPTDVRS